VWVVVTPFVVSRLISDALIVLARSTGRGRLSFGGFARWDGRWYLWIAQHGYTGAPPRARHHQTPWPFFPVLPAAMHAIHSISGVSLVLAGVLVNHAAFFVALVGIHHIAQHHLSGRAAGLAVWIAALGPFAFVFSMLYPSALFLAASVWAFVLVEEHRDTLGGTAAAFAALTRPDGVIVAVVLACTVRRDRARVARIAGPAAVALGAWMVFNYQRTADALRFLHAKQAWHEIDLLSLSRLTPFDVLARTNPSAENALAHLAIAVVAFTLVVLTRRVLPTAWTWFTGLYLLPSLLLGIVGMGRYATEAFPPVVSAGSILESHPDRVVLAVCAALVVLQGLCAYHYLGQPALL
jgi:hypothetical protein